MLIKSMPQEERPLEKAINRGVQAEVVYINREHYSRPTVKTVSDRFIEIGRAHV